MSQTRNTGFLTNIIQYTPSGNISFVSGSTTLMSISSSGAITTTGVISGSNALSSSFAISSSFSLTGTTAATASSVSNLNQNVVVTGSLTTTGQIVAQTLNVQQVTSSIVFSSGSNIFGSSVGNTQQMTGSVTVTGSFAVATTATELQVGATGVTLGNVITDNHNITGSVRVSGSLNILSGSLFVGTNNQVGINTLSPESQFVVAAKTGNSASIEINLNNSGYGRIFAYNRAGVTAANLVLNDPGGNVGIGVTSVTEGKLQVNGITAAMNAGADGTLGVVMKFGNPSFPGTQHQRIRASTSASTTSNLLIFETSTATTDVFNTNQLVLRGDGNVGIGNLSPNTALSFANTTGNKIDFYNDGTARYSVQVNGGELRLYTSQTNDVISLYAGNVIGLVNRNGNVGIGTSSPSQRLEIRDAFQDYTSGLFNQIIYSTTSQSPGYGGSIGFGGVFTGTSVVSFGAIGGLKENATDNNTAGYLSFLTRANAGPITEKMRLSSAGNVGIGTSSPNHRLDVNGDINIPGTNRIVFNNEPGSWGITARTTTSTTNLGSSLKNIIICGGGTNEGIAFTGVGIATAMEIRNDGTVWVRGTLTKGGGSFRIDHPLPEKKDTHYLYHSFIEGPKADLIYRGKVNLVNGAASVNIDEVSTMTEGTFELLTRDAQCFVNNLSGWDLVRGNIAGNILTIISQNTESTDEISWMVVAERNDEWFRESEMTDDEGNTIVEKLKPIIE